MNFKAEHVMKTMFLGFTKSGTEYYIVLQESENEDGNIMNKKSKNSAILDLSGSCLAGFRTLVKLNGFVLVSSYFFMKV